MSVYIINNNNIIKVEDTWKEDEKARKELKEAIKLANFEEVKKIMQRINMKTDYPLIDIYIEESPTYEITQYLQDCIEAEHPNFYT